jgi:hypothetical protein
MSAVGDVQGVSHCNDTVLSAILGSHGVDETTWRNIPEGYYFLNVLLSHVFVTERTNSVEQRPS